MTPTLRSCWSSAREQKKKSMGSRRPRGAGRGRFEQVQHTVQDGHVFVWRYHIDAIRLDLHPVPDLENLHAGDPLEQFGHDPFMGRVEVLDNDKGQTAPFRHPAQKLLQRFQPAGGGADADNREKRSPLLWQGVIRGRHVLFFAAVRRFHLSFHYVDYTSIFFDVLYVIRQENRVLPGFRPKSGAGNGEVFKSRLKIGGLERFVEISAQHPSAY
jgi:hypothetical protein